MANGELKIGFIGFGEAGFNIARGLRGAGVDQLVAYRTDKNEHIYLWKVRGSRSGYRTLVDDQER